MVVPKGSSDGLKGIVQKAIDDARQQLTDKLNEQFDKAWEDFKHAIQKRIEQELSRQVNRATGGICGAAPAGMILAGGIVWWRRKRRSGVLPPSDA